MKRTVLFIICSIFTIIIAFAQGKPEIKFDVSAHDFGEIAEEAGNASYDFSFTNTGDAPLVITRVSASCGCTTPSWTKEPIPPGGKGVVTATYGAKGRPGPFSKTVSVYSNNPVTPIVLSIKGNVTPKTLSPEEAYPVKMGDLRLKQSVFNLGITPNTEQKTQTVDIYNIGANSLTLKYDKLPKYITVSCEPQSIPANSAGKLTMSFNSPMAKAYGRLESSFEIVVNNDTKSAAENKIQLVATLIDDFSSVNSSVPKMAMNPSYVNFGNVSDANFRATQILKISNSGSSNLILRSVKATKPEVSFSASKMVIKPGEIIEIKLTAQAKKIKSPINGVLEIITNDPNAPINEIRYYVQP